MAKSVWKFKVTTGEQKLRLPSGATPLDVQVQNGDPCVWFLVDDSNDTEVRSIQAFGTGHKVPDSIGDYIGTFQLNNGMLVFHLFFTG